MFDGICFFVFDFVLVGFARAYKTMNNLRFSNSYGSKYSFFVSVKFIDFTTKEFYILQLYIRMESEC